MKDEPANEGANEPATDATPSDPRVVPGAPSHGRELAGHRLDVLAAIAIGGVAGAEGRYGIGLALPHQEGAWPWATLLVNLSGCFLIGVLMIVITEVIEPHRLLRPCLGVGVLGGYTTFSTYTVDGLSMARAERFGLALAYLVLTPVLAVLACALGAGLTRLAAPGGYPRGQRGKRR